MAEKQLNVWIPEELRAHVAQRAEQEGRPMNAIIAELIRQDIARTKGDLVERQSMPVMSLLLEDTLQRELRYLREQLREDRAEERAALRDYLRRQFDRLSGLLVHAIRNAGIARRLTYTSIAKAHGSSFAKLAYDDATEKARQELNPKRTVLDEIEPGRGV